MIDIDDVWQSLGYARRDYLVQYLKSSFEEGTDYRCSVGKDGKPGRPKVGFLLTQECYDKIRSRGFHQTGNVYREKIYRAKLFDELGGKKDAHTPVGKIDLLTGNTLIEVKEVKNWKSGLGQLLAYAYFHRKLKRLHLFGECDSETLSVIAKVCWKYKVKVTWEP